MKFLFILLMLFCNRDSYAGLLVVNAHFVYWYVLLRGFLIYARKSTWYFINLKTFPKVARRSATYNGDTKMAFIRIKKLKRDDQGKIVSGSAAIIDTIYVPGNVKHHSKQAVREKLGKIIELYSNKRGLFLSPTRGLVIYDSQADEFSSPISKEEMSVVNETDTERVFPEPDVHTIFGDVYLLIEIMRKTGILGVLAKSFTDKIFLQRLLCHLSHGILKDRARITCDDFVAKSFASYISRDVPLSSLKSDTAFFMGMGEDKTKLAFFRAYVYMMRKTNKDFGKACFVDSTPLPNDIDSPFTALCSHGIGSSSTQMRLVFILDEATLLPIWFDIIPGNVMDVNTLKFLTKDVEISLDIHLNGFYLDAGYASRELIQSFVVQENEEIPERKYLVRMPARKGYPYRYLYTHMKTFLSRAKYDFVRNGHSYFGKMKEVTIFDNRVYAYVYVDHNNALKGYTEFTSKYPEEFAKLTNREKDWYKVKFGYFILLSNCKKSPIEVLDEYFARSNVEKVFKTSKEYLKLLPLNKWHDQTIQSKILCDIIDSIIRQSTYEIGKRKIYSMSSMIARTQSLMCAYNNKD